MALALLRRFWPYLLGGAAVLALTLWAGYRGYNRGVASQQPQIAALERTIADVRAASAAALASDLARAREVETRDAAITRETNDALAQQLAAARAAADDLSRRLRAEAAADPGRGAGADMPGAADASDAADGARDASVVAADNRACGEAVIKAEGWQAWWRAVSREAR